MANKDALRNEYLSAELGDVRRAKRMVQLAEALALVPGDSFPDALGDGAALEAAYRFFNTAALSPAKLLAPHQRETVTRCGAHEVVIVAHDTTSFVFPGETRRGLGRLNGDRKCGFFSHVALAVTLNDRRDPLGVLHVENLVRAPVPKTARAKQPRQRQKDPDRESLRWHRGVTQVEGQLRAGHAIHVMDREGDAYELLAHLAAANARYIIRAKTDRTTVEGDLMSNLLAAGAYLATETLDVPTRIASKLPRTKKRYPARLARQATLGLKACTITLRRPPDLTAAVPSALTVNVVLVEEVEPPAEEAPVKWLLLTSEPIATVAMVKRIIAGYRTRWRIEEFFKALKTGCAIEKRQLESKAALENALAIYMPIAWRAMRHRTRAAFEADAPASELLNPLQLQLLRAKQPRGKLSDPPTLGETLVVIAALGGHLKRNGPPGIIVISRGYERLLTLEEGARLYQKCDQS